MDSSSIELEAPTRLRSTWRELRSSFTWRRESSYRQTVEYADRRGSVLSILDTLEES